MKKRLVSLLSFLAIGLMVLSLLPPSPALADNDDDGRSSIFRNNDLCIGRLHPIDEFAQFHFGFG